MQSISEEPINNNGDTLYLLSMKPPQHFYSRDVVLSGPGMPIFLQSDFQLRSYLRLFLCESFNHFVTHVEWVFTKTQWLIL